MPLGGARNTFPKKPDAQSAPRPQPPQPRLWLRLIPLATSGHCGVSSEWGPDLLTKTPFVNAVTQCEESSNICLLYQRLYYLLLFFQFNKPVITLQPTDRPQSGLASRGLRATLLTGDHGRGRWGRCSALSDTA